MRTITAYCSYIHDDNEDDCETVETMESMEFFDGHTHVVDAIRYLQSVCPLVHSHEVFAPHGWYTTAELDEETGAERTYYLDGFSREERETIYHAIIGARS